MKRKLHASRSRQSVDKKGLLLLISAFLFGGSLVYYGQRMQSQMNIASDRDVVRTVRVLVPATSVPAGTKGSDIPLLEKEVPETMVTATTIRTMLPYVDARTRVALQSNLPMSMTQFAVTNVDSNPVLSRIPEGMRAITLRVDVASAVEGWAGSGSSVDVLLIEDETTSVIAENVKILSAERSVTPIEGEVREVPQTVTILVHQDQALAIVTAVPRGRIAFALRPEEDQGNWQDKVFTASRLIGAARKRRPAQVKGFVSFTNGIGESRNFALSDGKWIKADAIPAGVLLGVQ